ncbi:MAG: hypothetical protein KUG77_12980, partial [Nannocystaceae bacterium]|nr:hypothetical protein [Nannocystaceae bacterium]
IAAAWDLNINTIYTRIRKLRASLREEAVADQARHQQPAATARAWAALLPALKPWTVLASGLSAGWVAAIVAVAVGGAALLVKSDPQPASTPLRTAFHIGPKLAPAEPASLAPRVAPSAPVAATAPVAVRQAAAAVPKVSTMASPVAAPEPVSTLAQENAMLVRAQAALRRGDAEQALRETAVHASRFPDGVLTDVRAVVRIEALCVLNKAPQARAEASLLLKQHPTMTSRRRLAKSCAGSPRNPPSPDMTGA